MKGFIAILIIALLVAGGVSSYQKYEKQRQDEMSQLYDLGYKNGYFQGTYNPVDEIRKEIFENRKKSEEVSALINFSSNLSGAGFPKIVSDDDFDELFLKEQVYYLENDPLPFPDETVGLLLSKIDNDFGEGNGDYYAVSCNTQETKFFRIPENKINGSLRTGNLVINKDGKFNKYQPVIRPLNKT